MQDQLASRYYIVIYIDSQCDQNGWIDYTLVPEFCKKNFLEEDFSSYLNLETLFHFRLSLYYQDPRHNLLLVVKQIE